MMKSVSFFRFLCVQSRAETLNTPDNLKPSITSWRTCDVLQWKVTLQLEPISLLCHVGGTFTELRCEFTAKAEFWPNLFKPNLWHADSGDGRVTQRVLRGWNPPTPSCILFTLVLGSSRCLSLRLVQQQECGFIRCSEWLPVDLERTISLVVANLVRVFVEAELSGIFFLSVKKPYSCTAALGTSQLSTN